MTPLRRLQDLLRDLLQLDLSDLDFGIYRLLRVKRAEINAFPEEQPPAVVSDAFDAAEATQRAAVEEALAREASRAQALQATQGEDHYRLHYLASLPLEASDTMLSVQKLGHPFRYEMEILTDEGPERRTVDLVETFNLVHGMRIRRLERCVNEEDGDGPTYRVVLGEDPEARSTMILWRDMEGLDPAVERTFLETT